MTKAEKEILKKAMKPRDGACARVGELYSVGYPGKVCGEGNVRAKGRTECGRFGDDTELTVQRSIH